MNSHDAFSNAHWLDEQIAKLEASISRAPKGGLQISMQRGHARFYVADSKAGTRRYLPAAEADTARRIAQRDYEEQILRTLRAHRAQLDKPDDSNLPALLDNVFSNLTPQRQALVSPYPTSDIDYVRAWESVEYEGKPFDEGIAYTTDKGESVRSKSEVIIANALLAHGIPYRYEYPLSIPRVGVLYPDFTVLNKRTRAEMHWEHFGMMDDPSYLQSALRKLDTYQKHGICLGRKLIITAESNARPLDTQVIAANIREYLE